MFSWGWDNGGDCLFDWFMLEFEVDGCVVNDRLDNMSDIFFLFLELGFSLGDVD